MGPKKNSHMKNNIKTTAKAIGVSAIIVLIASFFLFGKPVEAGRPVYTSGLSIRLGKEVIQPMTFRERVVAALKARREAKSIKVIVDYKKPRVTKSQVKDNGLDKKRPLRRTGGMKFVNPHKRFREESTYRSNWRKTYR